MKFCRFGAVSRVAIAKQRIIIGANMRAYLLLLSILLAGCGGSTASLSGNATYEGTPVAKGYITLQPADGKGESAGGEIVDGKFNVIGLKTGKKLIKIEAVKPLQFPKSSAEMAKAAESGSAPVAESVDIIPANAKGNGETIEIKPGIQTHDFNLTKP